MMSTIPAKPLSDYPWLARLLFWKQRRTYGEVLAPGLLWGRSPWLFATVALMLGALERKRSPLPPELRALVMVRVSQINHCAFCVDINSATLLKHGASMDKVGALRNWQSSNLFRPQERLALEYAEAITLNRVDDDLRSRVRECWNDDAVVELTGLIAFQNLSSKFNAALDVPAQGFCEIGRDHSGLSEQSP
jgi:AhpD family alkylhydroperoxidase